jgi:hydrogenase expression/formation protein HypC
MCLAIPGEVIDVHERHGMRFATVEFGGITRDVCLEYAHDAAVGDYVLVHVGFAIAKVDRAEAERHWNVLRELGEIDAELGGGR